ncbi:MAG TPA: DUF222 domain-containing protein [Polyangiaceae bacterium]|nr:DUF222 domain-containing protein [Polyangiaceae bacterium]
MVVRVENGECAEWMLAHEALSRLAKAHAQAEFEEGRWLVCALHAATHVRLGFGSFAEYIERLFGYSPRTTQEKVRVAEALEELPKTSAALAAGAVNWSTVRELTRVAIAGTEEEWLKVAQGKTVRQVEALVNGRSPGDTPDSPSDPRKRRHVLRFEVTAETWATFREAAAKLRRGCDFKLDDDSILLAMARHLLGGPTDEGRASYQIAINICRSCGSGAQQACGELIEVGPEVLKMAECDAQHIGPVERDAHGGVTKRATQTIPPAVRRRVMRRDRGRCVVPGCAHTQFVDVHHLLARADGGDHDEDGLAVFCCAHHRAVHEGRIVVEGRPSTGLALKHADGSSYGSVPSPEKQDLHTKLFLGLRGLGFGERDSRQALERVREELPKVDDAGTLLRAALGLLTPESG